MLYRSYILNPATGSESYTTTLMADDNNQAALSVAAWLGDHKRAVPGKHQIRLYSDEVPGFTQLTVTVR